LAGELGFPTRLLNRLNYLIDRCFSRPSMDYPRHIEPYSWTNASLCQAIAMYVGLGNLTAVWGGRPLAHGGNGRSFDRARHRIGGPNGRPAN
jgi:hypothetical protein